MTHILSMFGWGAVEGGGVLKLRLVATHMTLSALLSQARRATGAPHSSTALLDVFPSRVSGAQTRTWTMQSFQSGA